jgi:hypothetical protein
VYAIKMAKDIATLKAISQNLMHSNLGITDGVYGILSSADIKLRISQLGKEGNLEPSSTEELGRQLIELGSKLQGIRSILGNNEMN